MDEMVKVFENEEFGAVRTVSVDGEPWFVGKDVCAVFGDKNHNRSLGRVDDIDKKVIPITDSLGRNQSATFVNESGLYSLLFAMQPQKANHNGVSYAYPIEVQERIDKLRRFKRWVTSEVLPSIRKTGSYSVANTKDDYILRIAYANSVEERAIALNELNMNVIKPLEEQNAVQAQQIAEYEPKVTYYDLVLQTKDVLSVTQIAKDYGKSATWLNSWLHENGIQYKVGGTWVLYQKYADKGYTKTKTDYSNEHSWHHTYWTQKGRLFLYEKLKEQGILPVIEQE